MLCLLIVHFFFGVKEETEPKKKTQNVLSSAKIETILKITRKLGSLVYSFLDRFACRDSYIFKIAPIS